MLHDIFQHLLAKFCSFTLNKVEDFGCVLWVRVEKGVLNSQKRNKFHYMVD